MQSNSISSFYVTGVSYKKTDAALRGLFAINHPAEYDRLFQFAAESGISECFVISTCNRTEIYGFAPQPGRLEEVLCSVTEGSRQQFENSAYCFKGEDAIRHLFRVAAGLDSQILGDYEVIGQIKSSLKTAKEKGFIGANLERLANEVLRATKKVRTNTEFSSGTVSVSFAAIQFIKESYPGFAGKKILLIGTGKIGMHTCKNLVDYLPGASVTLMNRTGEKALALARSLQLGYRPMDELPEAVAQADVVLVATAAHDPIIYKDHFTSADQKLIIDLSIPFNVSPEVKEYSGIRLITVDELSKVKDETLQKRAAQIPVVEAIIDEHLNEYLQWHAMRKHAPVLKAVKSTLLSINAGNPVSDENAEQSIHQLVKGVAVKMKIQNSPGCHYLEAISHFMSPATDN